MPAALAIVPRPAPASVPAAPDGFGRLARVYRWLEYMSFGPWLALCRNARLRHPAVATARHALVLGDGDGRFLSRLLRWNPALKALSIDGSPGMLVRQRSRAARKGVETQLTTRCEDIRYFEPAESYDLVATHFFLDCLSTAEVEALGRRLHPHLTTSSGQSAVWIVSDFAIPGGAVRLPARLLVKALYLAFGIVTGLRTRQLPDHASALRRAGFTRIKRKSWLGGLLFSEVWSPAAPARTPSRAPEATRRQAVRSHLVCMPRSSPPDTNT